MTDLFGYQKPRQPRRVMTRKTEPDTFTEAIKYHCENRCGEFGEPPCYELPYYTGTQDNINPCEECKKLAERKRW